jgi:hypothetical protein
LVYRFDLVRKPGRHDRSLSDTFAGIRLLTRPVFILAQLAGLALALPLLHRSKGRRP